MSDVTMRSFFFANIQGERKMKRTLHLTMLLCLCAWLVACDIGSSAPSGGAYPAPSAPASAPPTSAQLAATPTRAPSAYPAPSSPTRPANVTLPAGVLAIYQRTGCFASVNETLTIQLDGVLQFVERGGSKQGKVAAERLNTLKQLFAQAEFANLQPLYQATGADLCTYRITALTSNAQARVVTTMDAAKHPEILNQVLAELTKLRAEIK